MNMLIRVRRAADLLVFFDSEVSGFMQERAGRVRPKTRCWKSRGCVLPQGEAEGKEEMIHAADGLP